MELNPVLAPGDAVRLVVWRRPEMSGEFHVSAAGTLRHPLLNEIPVAGQPFDVVQQRIRDYLTRLETTPMFDLEPLLRIEVGGEVRSPNVYRLPPETTIAQVVAIAGGPTERGRLDEVVLVRGNQTVRIDLTGGDAETGRATIRSGDQILVGRRTSVFREVILPATSVVSMLTTLVNIVITLTR